MGKNKIVIFNIQQTSKVYNILGAHNTEPIHVFVLQSDIFNVEFKYQPLSDSNLIWCIQPGKSFVDQKIVVLDDK